MKKDCDNCKYKYTFERCRKCTYTNSESSFGNPLKHFLNYPEKSKICLYYTLKEVACKKCVRQLKCILKK